MQSKWWADPPYRAYTVRELSGVAVMLYGAVLFVGLYNLWRGPDSFDAFVLFLRSPTSLVLHLLLLAGVIYHMVTWFETLPKTMPKLIVDGKEFPASSITRFAIVHVGFLSVCLVFVAIGLAR
jgi:fumarate reductase subunit C